MDKTVEPTMTLSSEALFRFTVVSQVINLRTTDCRLATLVREVAGRLHYQINGMARRVSERTIYRWLAVYDAEGLPGLEPVPQPRTLTSDVLGAELLEFLAGQRRLDPDASIPELIRRAREMGKLTSSTPVVRQTCWRALRRMGIDTRRRKKRRDRDTRRFAFPHRLDMVLADGKYFRAGAGRLRRVAVFFLDDATRFGLHVVVGTAGESAELFLRGLYEMVRKHGIADCYYLDHGPGFIAVDTVTVIGKLPSRLIHGEEAYPEGRGKIERFNRTAKAALFRNLAGRPDVDTDYRALELRLQHYLRKVYNHQPHGSLGGDTPSQRFHSDAKPLRLAESDEWLRQRFLVTESRLVTADHTIPIDAVNYELPRGYAGQRITIFRPLLDNKVLLLEQGRFIELRPVDLVANARDRRGGRKGATTDATTDAVFPKSAADLVYERDFAPVIGPDGGCLDLKED